MTTPDPEALLACYLSGQMAAAAAVEHVEAREMPYPTNPGGTHYEGCWQDRRHHNCAVALARRQENEIAALRAENERLREAAIKARAALTMMTDPASIRTTSVVGAYAACVAAEASLRAALAGETK